MVGLIKYLVNEFENISPTWPINEEHRGVLYIIIHWQSNLKDKQMY